MAAFIWVWPLTSGREETGSGNAEIKQEVSQHYDIVQGAFELPAPLNGTYKNENMI